MVRSALVYPVIPMNTLSRLQFSRLQTVQNKFLKFQQNIQWRDFARAEDLHVRANLPPVNWVIHKQAQKAWNNLKMFHPQMYQKLVDDTPEHRKYIDLWQSSRTIAEDDSQHTPIYSTNSHRGTGFDPDSDEDA